MKLVTNIKNIVILLLSFSSNICDMIKFSFYSSTCQYWHDFVKRGVMIKYAH